MPGLYVHIPFCAQKCRYCSFYSVAGAPADAIERYLNAVIAETAAHGKKAALPLTTLYIGGGSPSIVPPDIMKDFLSRLSDTLDLSHIAESTVEANPESFSRAWYDALMSLPALRISMGVQSVNDDTLSVIGRRARIADCERALLDARAFGVKNLSADIILGLPGESCADTKAGMERLIALAHPEHLSMYFLDLSGKETLSREWSSVLPDDEKNAHCYREAAALLSANGYERYEIANFARKGYRSRHNDNYWALGEYIGLGASASGHYGGRRYTNCADVNAYVACLEAGEETAAEEELLTADMIKEEFIFLSLRTSDGLNVLSYRDKFGEAIEARARTVLSVNARYLTFDGVRIRLTDEGFLFADEMAVQLMRSLE
ncbi:MAG: radical SAM family heme chaperone HemW [Spirochaetota bacterium]